MFSCSGPYACVLPSYLGIQFPDGSHQLTAASGGGGGGGISSVVGVLPIVVASPTSTPSISIQTADATHTGIVSITTQTLAGAKTFSTSVTTPSVLAPSGSSSINMSTQVMKDSTGIESIDFSNTVDTGRVLKDEFGNIALGFGASANYYGRALFSDEGNVILDFQRGSLSGNGTGGAVFASNMALSDGAGFTKIDWGNGRLRDTVPSTQLTWDLTGVGLPKLTASRVLTLNGSNLITTANPTVTEINFVSGVTSAIQTQMNTKQPTAYTPGNAAKWSGSPTTIQQAIDRIAAVVGNTIPIP